MRIVYEKSGGFAGLSQTKTIDSAGLSPEEVAGLQHLLDDCGFFDLPASIERPDLRDAFQYTITVDTGTRQHTVSITGEPQEPSLKALRQKLEKLA